jgi:Fe-S cluster biogenesis protein NfuA
MDIVNKIIEEKIRPILWEHKGDIELVEVTPDGYVHVRLIGACATCLGTDETMAQVEVVIKAACPTIKRVVDSNVSDELFNQAWEIFNKWEK